MVKEYFKITVSDNKLEAYIHCFDNYEDLKKPLVKSELMDFLHEHHITFGIDEEVIEKIVNIPPKEAFPFTIAKGVPAENGKDGTYEYRVSFDTEIKKTSDWNFRNVMRIPTVKEGDPLLTIIEPLEGKNGKDVYGNILQSKKGKPVVFKEGENVTLNKEDLTFYATAEGQISISGQYVHVYPVYELHEDVTMKVGNIDFVGSIIIHGDVPTGYSLKAKGDIKIFGIVEAATLIAGGSIYISEGFAGMGSGLLNAKENVHVGYINQGKVNAGDSIYVENSILHSECIAMNHIYCKRGNIIGGSLSVGKTVEAKDIGNRMSTRTEIYFGVNKTVNQKEKELLSKKEELETTLKKLEIIGKRLQSQPLEHNPKLRITLLRQRHSYNKTVEALNNVKNELSNMNSKLGRIEDARLTVKETIFPNVIVAFGKYKRTVDREFDQIFMKMEDNDIVIHSQNR